MSSKSDNQPPIEPLTSDEMRQVLSGFNQWVQQPVQASRFFAKIMQGINALLGLGVPERVAALEAKVEELEKKLLPNPPTSAPKPPTKPTKNAGSDLDKI